MQISQVDGRLPRTILAAMITDTTVLAEVSGYWPPHGLFQHRYQNLVAGWCVSYFAKHSAAPQHVIQTAFDAWSERNQGSEEIPFIARMLSYLSSEHQHIPAAYVIEQAGQYFNTHLARAKVNEVATLLDANRTEDAWSIIEGMQQITTGTNAYTDIGDYDAFLDAYDYAQGPDLIQWAEPFEALNGFFADQLGRGCFVSLMAAEKTGKSWWLMELAWQAAKCGNRVAFFSVGDMNAKQIRRRLISRICRRPIKARDIMFPTYIAPGGVIDEDSVNFRKLSYPEELSRDVFSNTLREWQAATTTGQNIRLYDAPMASMTAEGIRHRATRLVHSGWPPDVIVIDYADILAPINGGDESRHQSNRTWQELRRISQELDCLVLTATQTDAASYNVHTLSRANFSEDKRKFAHVTGMAGINQIEIERELQSTRLNWILGRELEVTNQLHVAGCLPVGRIALAATF